MGSTSSSQSSCENGSAPSSSKNHIMDEPITETQEKQDALKHLEIEDNSMHNTPDSTSHIDPIIDSTNLLDETTKTIQELQVFQRLKNDDNFVPSTGESTPQIDPTNFLNEPPNYNREIIQEQDAIQSLDDKNTSIPSTPESTRQIDHRMSLNEPTKDKQGTIQNENEINSIPSTQESTPQIDHIIDSTNLLDEPINDNEMTLYEPEAFQPLENQNNFLTNTPESTLPIDATNFLNEPTYNQEPIQDQDVIQSHESQSMPSTLKSPQIYPAKFLSKPINDNQETIQEQDASMSSTPQIDLTIDSTSFLNESTKNNQETIQSQNAFRPLKNANDDSLCESSMENITFEHVELEENPLEQFIIDESMVFQKQCAFDPLMEEDNDDFFSETPMQNNVVISDTEMEESMNCDIDPIFDQPMFEDYAVKSEEECFEFEIISANDSSNTKDSLSQPFFSNDVNDHVKQEENEMNSLTDTESNFSECTKNNIATIKEEIEVESNNKDSHYLSEDLNCFTEDSAVIKDENETDNSSINDTFHDATYVPQLKLMNCTKCSFTTDSRLLLDLHVEECELELRQNQLLSLMLSGIKQTCYFCPFESDNLEVLKEHHDQHSNQGEVITFECEKCSYSTENRYQLIAHSLIHKSKFKCDQCAYFGADKRTQVRHIKLHKTNSTNVIVTCRSCRYEMLDIGAWEGHLSAHALTGQAIDIWCAVCLWKSSVPMADNQSLVKTHHTRTNHQGFLAEISKFRCIVGKCSFAAYFKWDYLKHIKINHADLKCNRCDFVATAKSILLEHLQTVHKIQSNAEESPVENKPSEVSFLHKTQHLTNDRFVTSASKNQFGIHQHKIQSKNTEFSNMTNKNNKLSDNSSTTLSFEIQNLPDDEASFEVELKQNEKQHQTVKVANANLNLKRKSDSDLDISQSKITKTGLESDQWKACKSAPYKCFFCPFGSYSKKLVDDHEQKDHKIDGQFACFGCNYLTPKRCNLRTHRFDVHKNDIFCSYCKFKTTYKSKFIRHVIAHKRAKLKLFGCAICDKHFICYRNFQRHKVAHDDVILLCDKCIFTVETVDDLLNHKYEAHGLQTYMCLACEFWTTGKSYFNYHISLHSSLNNTVVFKCTLCKINFPVLEELIAHQNEQSCVDAHQNKESIVSSLCYVKIDVLLYGCRFCTFNSAFVDEFNEHKQLHGSYVCVGCHFFTNEKQNYDRHVLMHKKNNETTYSINLRDFNLKEDLTYNVLLAVIGVISYGCTECGFQTTHLVKLTLHKKSHEFITYTCSDCSFETTIINEFNQHLAKHKKDTVIFKCLNYCGCVDLDNACHEAIDNLNIFRKHQIAARHSTHLITVIIQSKQVVTHPGEQSINWQSNKNVLGSITKHKQKHLRRKHTEEKNKETSFNLEPTPEDENRENLSQLKIANIEKLTTMRSQIEFDEGSNSLKNFKNQKQLAVNNESAINLMFDFEDTTIDILSQSDKASPKGLTENQNCLNLIYESTENPNDTLNILTTSDNTAFKGLVTNQNQLALSNEFTNNPKDIVNMTSDDLMFYSEDTTKGVLSHLNKAALKGLTANQNHLAVNYKSSENSNDAVNIISNYMDSNFEDTKIDILSTSDDTALLATNYNQLAINNELNNAAFKGPATNQTELVVKHETTRHLKDTGIITLDTDSNFEDNGTVTDTLDSDSNFKDMSQSDIETVKGSLAIQNQLVLNHKVKTRKNTLDITVADSNVGFEYFNEDVLENSNKNTRQLTTPALKKEFSDYATSGSLSNSDASDNENNKCIDAIDKNFEYVDVEVSLDLLKHIEVNCKDPLGKPMIKYEDQEKLYENCNNSQDLATSDGKYSNVVYKCLICDLKMSDEIVLNEHILKHMAKNHSLLYKCSNDFCKFTCDSLNNLKLHVKSVCNNLSSNLLLIDVQLLKCQFCHYEIHETAKYDAHKTFHSSTVSIKRLTMRDAENVNMSFIYKCLICLIDIYDEEVFEKHVLVHTSKTHSFIYKCSNKHCEFQCNSLDLLKEHMNTTHNHILTNLLILDVQMLKCRLCRYTTFETAKYKAHKNIHSSKVSIKRLTMCDVENFNMSYIYKCLICCFYIYDEEVFKKHVLLHTFKIHSFIFKCSIKNCEFHCNSLDFLKQHMKSNHNNLLSNVIILDVQMLKCQLCHYKTFETTKYDAHRNVHSSVVSIDRFSKSSVKSNNSFNKNSLILRCEACPFESDIEDQITHYISNHCKVILPLERILYLKIKCIHCKKEFLSVNLFCKHHQQDTTHTDVTVEIITISDKFLISTFNLCTATNYECKICAFKTKQDNALYDHIAFHKYELETVILTCLCDRTFLNLIEFKTHKVETRHSSLLIRPTTYECGICYLPINSKKSFKNHIIFHRLTSNVLFVCKNCNKSSLDLDEFLRNHTQSQTCETIIVTLENGLRADSYPSVTSTVSKSESMRYKCRSCAFNTTQVRHFEDHIECHILQNDRVVLACSCGVKYLNLNELKQHNKETGHFNFALDLFSYECVLCNLQVFSKKEFEKHTLFHKTNSQPLRFVCFTCDKKSCDLDDLLEMHKNTILCDVILAKIIDQNQINNTKSITAQETLPTISNEPVKYECKSCAFITTQVRSFDDHIEYHSLQNERVVLACVCGVKYLNLNELQSHKQEKGHFSFALELFSYRCGLCNLKVLSKKSFKNHLHFHKIHSQTLGFVCFTCDKKSFDLDELLKVHKKTILCDVILAKIVDQHEIQNTSITTQETLQTAINETVPTISNGPVTYECKTCAFKTTRVKSFGDHIQYHSLQNERVVLSCSCGVKYLNLNELKSHKTETCHISFALELFSYRCGLCNLQCFSKKEFINHLNVHTMNSQTFKFICFTCDKKSLDLDDMLKMHKKSTSCDVILAQIVNQNNHEVACFCGVKYLSLNELESHQKEKGHSYFGLEDFSYRCVLCHQVFSKKAFQNHIIFHDTNGQTLTFMCSTCKKRSCDLDDLLEMHKKSRSKSCRVILGEIVDQNSINKIQSIPTQEFLPSVSNDSTTVVANLNLDNLTRKCHFPNGDLSFDDHEYQKENMTFTCSCGLNYPDFDQFKIHQKETLHFLLTVETKNTERCNLDNLETPPIMRKYLFKDLCCDLETDDEESFKRHALDHTAQNQTIIFTCSVQSCDFISNRLDDLKTHCHNETDNLNVICMDTNMYFSYICVSCNLNLLDEDVFNDHVSEHTNKEEALNYKCSNKSCAFISESLESLKTHMKSIVIHFCSNLVILEIKLFKCLHCHYETNKNAKYVAHQNFHSSVVTIENIKHFNIQLESKIQENCIKKSLIYKCEFCQFESDIVDYINYHIFQHIYEEQVAYIYLNCNYCKKLFSSIKALQEYHQVDTSHIPSLISLEVLMSFGQETFLVKTFNLQCTIYYECKICIFKTSQSNALKQHVAFHNSINENVILVCLCNLEILDLNEFEGHRSKTGHIFLEIKPNNTLSRRDLIQSKPSVYECKQCAWKTDLFKDFKDHITFHISQNERGLFTCVCDNKYFKFMEFQTHVIKTGHGSGVAELISYKCGLCNAKISLKDSFKTHISQVHSNYVTFVCKPCNQSYLDLDDLLKVHEKALKCDTIIAQERIQTQIDNDKFLTESLEKRKIMENEMNRTSLPPSLLTAKDNLSITCECKICDNNATQNLNFLNHLEMHRDQIENIKYVCVCKGVYFNLKDFMTHRKKTSHFSLILETIDYICVICNSEIKSQLVFKQHKTYHGQRGVKYKYWCYSCNTIASDLDGLLNRHRKSKICDTFVLMNKFPVRVYSCRKCRYKTTTECRFREHVEAHYGQHDSVNFACICNAKYPNFTQIRGHQKENHHFGITLEITKYMCQPCNIYLMSLKSFRDHISQCKSYNMKTVYFSCNENCCVSSSNLDIVLNFPKKYKKCDTIVAKSTSKFGNTYKSTDTSTIIAIDSPIAKQQLTMENGFFEQVNPVLIKVDEEQSNSITPNRINSSALSIAIQNPTCDSSIRLNSNIFIANGNNNARKGKPQVNVANANFPPFNFTSKQNAVRCQTDITDLNTNVNPSPIIVNFNNFNTSATPNATVVRPQDNISQFNSGPYPSPIILNFDNFSADFLQNATIVKPKDNIANLSVNVNPSPLLINFDHYNVKGDTQHTLIRPKENSGFVNNVPRTKANLNVSEHYSSLLLNSNASTAIANTNATIVKSTENTVCINSLTHSNVTLTDTPYSGLCNKTPMYINSANVNTFPVQNNANNVPIQNVMINYSINPQFNVIPNSKVVPIQHVAVTTDKFQAINVKSEPLDDSECFAASTNADIFDTNYSNAIISSNSVIDQSIVKHEDC